MEKTTDVLLERLLAASMRLEQAVTLKDSDPDEWLILLDEREELIKNLQESGWADTSITERHRQILTQVHDVNHRLVPLMDGRKQGVQKQLNNVHRSKQAMSTYQDVGPSGYGAFFDRKK